LLTCRECNGILNVVAVETVPAQLSKQEKLIYNRLCDVQCLQCGKMYYSQPYDFGKSIKPVRHVTKNLKPMFSFV
jgi:hypothetical protein